MNRIVVASLAAFAAFGGLAAAPASAESVNVEYHDLDLFDKKGRAELDRRIDRAARQVCGVDDIRTGTRVRDSELRCYREAKAKAGVQVARIMNRGRLGG